jgi:CheY-like chemotaxis protein
MVTADGDPIKILYADDDDDDGFLFRQALDEVNPFTKLKLVTDGEKLMKYLASADEEHPDIIFLDINMPCKNGKQCLKEIRSNKTTSKDEKDIE